MPRPNKSRAGFALIEVLAALVITASLVAVVLPFASHLLARWRTGQPEIDSADTWMQAIARLSDDLAQAVPITGAGASSEAVEFHLAPGSVKFVRPSLGDRADLGLETVTYVVGSSPAGDVLVRYAQPFVPERFGDETQASPKSIILDGPFRLAFAPMKSGPPASAAGPPPKAMPAGIELRVRGLSRARVPAAPIVLPIEARGSGAKPAPPAQKEL